MGHENEQLFSVLRAALWQTPCPTPDPSIRPELRAQTVDGLTADIFSDDALSAQHMIRFMRMAYTQQEAIEAVAVPAAVIKGFAAGIYYPKPHLRTYGDIDLLVRLTDYAAAIDGLENAGFVMDGMVGHYHTAFHKDGFEIELHQSPPGLDDVPEGDFIRDFILSGLDTIETAAIGEKTFPMLPWQQNGLELIWHIREHLYNGLGLRQIIDWMMFAHDNLDDAAFCSYASVLEKGNLLTLAKVITRMCQLYLGLSETITWCEDADDGLCEKLMEYILSQGNFGGKRSDDKVAKVLTRYTSPGAFLKGMQRKGLAEWEAVKKYPSLRPIAWTYSLGQGVKYFREYRENRKELKRRKTLFDRLY